MSDMVVKDELVNALNDKLKEDLEKFQSQYREILKQSDELQKSQQNLVRQRIALEALIGYLSVKTN
jgi:hypothetical protein